MQTCSKCYAQSPDTTTVCVNCKADLTEYSNTAVALKRLIDNPRVLNIRLVVGNNCCPACREAEGTFTKDNVPNLPVVGCSHALGCQCFYEPMLSEIYP